MTAARPRVLIVEDEPGLAEVLALHFSQSGYEPAIAPDGLAALGELDAATPQAVILDLMIPVVSGFRLIKLIKRQVDTDAIPVVVLTALSFQEGEDAVRAGAGGRDERAFFLLQSEKHSGR